MSRKIADFVHRLCAGPDLSDLRDMDPSTVRNSRFQSEGISVALTSWELKALSKSWRALVAQQSVGLVLFAALFDKYPMSRAVFGLKGSNKEFALADYRVKRQALIIEDTIAMVIEDLLNDGDGLRWPLVCVGEAHVRLACRGFHEDYLNAMGEALLDLVAQQACVNRLKRWKVLRIWRRLLFFIVSCLLRGFHLGRTQGLEAPVREQRLSCPVDEKHRSLSGAGLLEQPSEHVEDRRQSHVQNQLLSVMALSVPMRV